MAPPHTWLIFFDWFQKAPWKMLHWDLIFVCAGSLLDRETPAKAAREKKKKAKSYNQPLCLMSRLSQEPPPPPHLCSNSVKCRYITGKKFQVNIESSPYTSPLSPNALLLMEINLDTEKWNKRRVKNYRGITQSYLEILQVVLLIHSRITPLALWIAAH